MDELPAVFTVQDVLSVTGMSRKRGGAIRVVLDGLIGDGVLFRSVVVGRRQRGRPPIAWSKTRDGIREEVIYQQVSDVLGSLPRYFTMKELLAGIGMSQRFRLSVRGALDRLEDEGHVVRVSDRQMERKGRPPALWSANRDVILAELSFQAIRARERQDRLERLSKTWDPFANGSTGGSGN